MLKLLIVDNHNSIRSQILEAYLAKALNKRAQVISAGKEATGIDPQAIRIMAEDGYVIAGQTSKSLKEVEAYPYNAILFCAENLILEAELKTEQCQVFYANFSEIEGFGGVERLQEMRVLRDEIKGFAKELVSTLLK